MVNLRATHGYSLLELVFALGLIVTLTGVTTAKVLAGLDDFRTAGAVRYVSGRIQRARMDAVSRNVNTGMRVVRAGSSYGFGIYADGNGDGVRTRDIQDGIDKPIQQEERLADQFPGVDFGALPGLPAPDASGTAPGSDPIRLGVSDMAAFTPLGASTPGSLYILGPRGAQYVIRIFGETGKTRILKFNSRTWLWESL